MSETPIAIVCATCGGDPRASSSCRMCGGAGIGVASADGFLVWGRAVDDFSIAFRKIKRLSSIIFHLAILVFVLGGQTYVFWRLAQFEDFTPLYETAFWISGQPIVALFWGSLFVACFLIFRLKEYSHEQKDLPHWIMSQAQFGEYEKKSSERADHRFDVSPYFSEDALATVEDAYRIARDLNRAYVFPEMLFAAALMRPAGARFRIRLGMKFDSVKAPLARLMAESVGGQPPILFSREAKRTLALAYAEARNGRRRQVDVMEILLQAFKDSPRLEELLDQLGYPAEFARRTAEWIRLQEKMRDDHARFISLARLKPSGAMNRAMTSQRTPLLDRFSEDLTRMAANGYLAPIVGREKEINALLQAIESDRRSVVLVGENGVGKSALIEQLARRMVEEDVPPELFDRRLVSVDLAQVISSGEIGLAQERLMAMLQEVGVSGNIILAVHGIESLAGGSGSGPMDLAETFASELDRGYFIALATTTPRGWTEHLERRSLGSKLVKVTVGPMEKDDVLRVLMAKSAFVEYQQKIVFSFSALDKAAGLAMRYIYEPAAPENALDVMREAAVSARKQRGENAVVSGEDVARVVHEKTNIPVEQATQSEQEKLLSLESRLHQRVIGQNEAVIAVSQAMRRARAELREGKRPIANFLFLGPTGVGKTELAKSLAAEYFGSEKQMVRLDMSEYQERSSLARMIGTPGDERGGLLTEQVRHNPYTIVLLDEVEKAHPDILNLFLQVMDDGRLTDGVGRTVDFTNTVVIMTSNAGTAFVQEQITKQTPMEQIKTALLERELKGIFRPELLNRFDGIIVFKPLTLDDVTQIAWLFVNGVTERLAGQGVEFKAEDEAVERLAKQGFDPLFGARPLRRVIQEQIDNALADLILRNQVARKDKILLKADGTLAVEKAPAL